MSLAPTPGRLGWRRALTAVLVVVTYGAATLYHLRPAVLSCTTRTIGPIGDGTAGGVWLAWAFERHGGGPLRDTTPLTAAPGGEAFWRPEWWTQALLYVPLWLYGHVTNAVCSYNVVLVTGFLASALAMFALAMWLTRHVAVSLLAGYAFAFAPFAQLKAAGHLAYVHQEAFPLILLAGLALLERPSPRRAVLLGVVAGLAGYLDGYYLLFSALMLACLAVLGLARVIWARREPGATLARAVGGGPAEPTTAGRLIAQFALAGIVAGALLIPLAAAYATGSSTVAASVTRRASDLDVYSADLSDYLLPARTSPIFDDVFGEWQDRHLGATNYSESTLFLGWSTIVLAAVALVATVRRRGPPAEPGQARRWSLAVPLLVATAVVLALASGPRVWELLGIRFPGFSWFVYLVAPYWRVYARLFMPVHAAALAAAAVGTVVVLRHVRAAPARIAVLAVLALVVGVETTASPPLEYSWFDYSAAPQGYRWIAERDDVELVADYPVWPVSAQPNGDFATFQPVHGKAVVNPKGPPAGASVLNASVLGLADDQTIPLLRHLGVDLVVVHPGLMPGEPPGSIPDGLELVRSFRFADQVAEMSPEQAERHAGLAAWYDMDIYRLVDGPTADVAVVAGDGLHPPELTGWRSGRWVRTPDAALEVVALEPGIDRVRVQLRAESVATVREVSFVQDGTVLWRGEVPTGESAPISFEAAPGRIAIESTPGPAPIPLQLPGSTDGREASVFISELDGRLLAADEPVVAGGASRTP